MQEIMEKILLEISNLRVDFNKKFEEQDKKFEKIERRFEQQDKEIERRFKQQNKEIERRFEQQNKEIERRFEQQNKEIAQEFQEMAKYISKQIQGIKYSVTYQDKRINTIEKENKIAHDGYNAKMYKIELSQSNLESKVYDLENKNLISNE